MREDALRGRIPLFVLLAVSCFLGLSLWAALLGWLVSPWLEIYGLVVLLLLVVFSSIEGGSK